MGQRGMVTVETAFSLLFVALASTLAIGAAAGVFLLGQCQVTANEVARQTARGDSAAVARAVADAPHGAEIDQRSEAGVVVVEVSRAVRVGPATVPVQAQARVLEER